jgi:hypothetical protein
VYRKRKRESNMKEKMFSLPILLLFLSPSLIFLANNIEELVREGRVRWEEKEKIMTAKCKMWSEQIWNEKYNEILKMNLNG